MSERVRVVSELQAAQGQLYISRVQVLENFLALKYNGKTLKIDGENLKPGSCIFNVTQNMGPLRSLLVQNVEWATAVARFNDSAETVEKKLHEPYSKGASLTTAITKKIDEAEIPPNKKQELKEVWRSYTEAIKQQEKAVRESFKLDQNYTKLRVNVKVPKPQ